jgi:hypothetical protein
VDRTCEKDERTTQSQGERKDNWIGYILRRNCLLKHVIEENIGEIYVTRRRGKRRKLLLCEFKKTRGCRKLKEKALVCTMENPLSKRLWTCLKTDSGTDGSYNLPPKY